jgi:hypothetical protein
MNRSIQGRVEKLEAKAGLGARRTDYGKMTDEELDIAIYEDARATMAEVGGLEMLEHNLRAAGEGEDLIDIVAGAVRCATLQEWLEKQRRQRANP